MRFRALLPPRGLRWWSDILSLRVASLRYFIGTSGQVSEAVLKCCKFSPQVELWGLAAVPGMAGPQGPVEHWGRRCSDISLRGWIDGHGRRPLSLK